MEKVNQKIAEWFAGGCDFDEGIALLQQVNRNTYYVNNIHRARKQKTLEYELKRVLIKAGVKAGGGGGTGKGQGKGEGKGEGKGLTVGTVGTVEKGEGKGEVGNHGRVWNIREEFPFLDDKNCPDELKILVADMITTHKQYVEGHSSLFAVVNKGPAACYEAARKTVENYMENRKIWKELEYYKKYGKLLGEHPIFARRKKEQEIQTLTYPELKKYRKNIIRQIDYRFKKTGDGRRETGVNDDILKEIEELKRQLAQVSVLIEKYEKK